MIQHKDRLPVWQLCKSLDHPRSRVIPLLRKLELPVEYEGDEVFTSRSAFRELLYEVAE